MKKLIISLSMAAVLAAPVFAFAADSIPTIPSNFSSLPRDQKISILQNIVASLSAQISALLAQKGLPSLSTPAISIIPFNGSGKLVSGRPILFQFSITAQNGPVDISGFGFTLGVSPNPYPNVVVDNFNVYAFTDSGFSSVAAGVGVDGSMQRNNKILGSFSASGLIINAESANGTPTVIHIPAGATYYFVLKADAFIPASQITVSSSLDMVNVSNVAGSGWINNVVTALRPHQTVTSVGIIVLPVPSMLSVALDPSTPSPNTVAAGSTNVSATVLEISAANEAINFQRLGLQFDGSNVNAITEFTIWDGTTQVGSGAFVTGRYATTTLWYPVAIPQNAYKLLTIKVNLSLVGTSQPAQVGDTVAINYDGDDQTATQGTGQSTGNTIYASGVDTAASRITLGLAPSFSLAATNLSVGETLVGKISNLPPNTQITYQVFCFYDNGAKDCSDPNIYHETTSPSGTIQRSYDTTGWAVSPSYKAWVAVNGIAGTSQSNAVWFSVTAPKQAFVWSQVSTNGQISQKLYFAASLDSFYGIGNDQRIWRWDLNSKMWVPITACCVKNDFTLANNSESDIYAIGLDNQIWHWNGSAWSQSSSGGQIMQRLFYVSPSKIYGIGLDNGIWRWNGGNSWTQITPGLVKDDFILVNNSENDIYAIGIDNQIWHWNGSAWSQASSGGQITQRLFYVSPSKIYGIGLDSRIWKWTGGSNWTQVTTSGAIKDDFFLVGSAESSIYAIGLDNQIWHWHWSFLGFGIKNANPNFASILYGIQTQLNEIAAKIKILLKAFAR